MEKEEHQQKKRNWWENEENLRKNEEPMGNGEPQESISSYNATNCEKWEVAKLRVVSTSLYLQWFILKSFKCIRKDFANIFGVESQILNLTLIQIWVLKPAGIPYGATQTILRPKQRQILFFEISGPQTQELIFCILTWFSSFFHVFPQRF